MRVLPTMRAHAVGAAWLVCLCACDGGGAAHAQQEYSPKGPYEPADDELALMQLYRDGRLVTARRKADALLEARPFSILGHYVLGQVFRESEGQLPQSMKHLGRARELFESRYPTFPLPEGPMRELHRELLFAAQGVAGELERFEYQLSLLDFYDSLYSPELVAEHAWPLMRLGQLDKARQFARRAQASKVAESRSLGLNAMCAIEGEATKRQSRLDACVAAFEDAQQRAMGDAPMAGPHERTAVAVHAYNAAQAAAGVLRPDEVERLAIAGTARLDFTPANPWRILMRLYLDQARVDDGVYALRQMLRWRQRQPPYLREQDRAQTDAAHATFLLVVGRTAAGLRLADRAVERPDRRGLTSSTQDQAVGAHALLRLVLRRTDAEHRAERATWGGPDLDVAQPSEGPSPAMRLAQRAARRLADRERIRGIVADETRLLASFRPYVHGGLEPVPSWLVGELVDILGAGVCRVMLERARASEADDSLTPYYDALEAEVALAEGASSSAMSLAQGALRSLPQTEVLLRARVAAVAAQAAAADGDQAQEGAFLAQTMQLDPGTIRRRGLSIPARVDDRSTGALGPKVAAGLAESPRVRAGDRFVVVVSGADRALRICLSTQDGVELSCTEVDLSDARAAAGPQPDVGEQVAADATEAALTVPLTDAQAAARALQAFHDRAFGFGLELSAVDLRSLDGTAVVSEEAARGKMQAVLDEISEVE